MKDEPVELASEALRRLRAAMSGMEAPPATRAAALEAYRNRAPRRRTGTLLWIIAAVAAGVAFVVAGSRWVERAPAPAPVQAIVKPPAPPATVAKIVESMPPRTVVQRRPAARPRAVVAKKPAPIPPRATEVATDFLPIPFAPPLDPSEGGQVIRVRLPRAAMSSVGLPVSDNNWRDRVPADVVVGGDGIARAVRFVGFAK
jgi:hypothetical protein